MVDVYSDGDFADCASLKSVSGMVLRMYGNCVLWCSKRRDIIAGDMTEAELIAMSSAADELMWTKQLCTDSTSQQRNQHCAEMIKVQNDA